MYDCIAIGDIKLDTFVVLHEASVQCSLKLPECLLCIEYGKKIPVQNIDSQIAGSAPNVAVGLARLGKRTAIVSVMGRDNTFDLARKRLADEHVSTRYIKGVLKHRSSFGVVIDYHGEKTILAAHEPFPYHLPKLPPTHWFYVAELGTGYVSLFQKLIKKLPTDHVKFALNPGAVQIEERKKVLYDLIKKTSILFVNVGEARTLTGLGGDRTIQELLAATWKLNHHVVVVTDGPHGAYACDGTSTLFLPIFPGKRIQSTGAGDSFATGVLGATLNGLPLAEALRWGAVNASSVVQHMGPQAGLLSERNIRSHLRCYPHFKTTLLS